MIPIEDLTSEKTLWQIYRKSRVIGDSRFNKWSSVGVALLLTLDLVATRPSPAATVLKARELALLGLPAALGVLGFLIAGFTIFVTLCHRRLLIQMATTAHATGLSWFKYNFFVFMRVFIYYLLFTVLCLFAVLFASPKSGVAWVLGYSPDPALAKTIIARTMFVALSTAAYFVLMQLKSFVFNVYHVVATWLRWEAENPDGGAAPHVDK